MSLPTNFFIGRGGAAADQPLFDDYGVFGLTFPSSPTLNSSVTLTHILTVNATSSPYDNYSSVKAQLLDGDASGYDPLHARLVTAHSNNNAVQPIFYYPSSGYDWSTVSSSSHISGLAGQSKTSSSITGSFSIGGSLYTDTTSTKVISRAINYTPHTDSDYGVGSHYYVKNPSGSGYIDASFNMPTSDNYHGRGTSTRFNRAHNSTERMLMNVAKDQSGKLENVSGMPNVIQANVFDTNTTSLISPQSTQSAVARTSYNLSSSNTHGNHNRAAYLGGRQVGNVQESFYVGIYYDHTSGVPSYRGRRYVKFSHNLSTNTVTTQVGDHIADTNINSSGGHISYGNQVYPHAYYSIVNSSNSALKSNTSSYHYYVDLSGTWGQFNNSLAETYAGNHTFNNVSRVGTNANGNPVYAIHNSGNLFIYEYTPSGNTWSDYYASTATVSTPTDKINGIIPIPQTNRFIVSNQGGFVLYELNIP